MREFYRSWNMRKFDQEFAEYANQFDLLVFGGGNFFELCWDYSAIGTTIDLSEACLKKIKVPILLNGLGVDDKKGTVSLENIRKFGIFLEQLIERKEFITVRNDGSQEILQRYYDRHITEKIRTVPDGGFFVNPKKYEHIELPGQKMVMAVNVAGDSREIRFAQAQAFPSRQLSDSQRRLTAEEFCQDCQSAFQQLLERYPELHIVMVPHIIKDLEMISQVISKLPDPVLRTRVSVAPCVNGGITDGEYIADLYRQSDLVLGMRYHANIAAIAGNTSTIGIVNFEKHKKMYEEIGLSKRLLPSDEPGFAERLVERVRMILENPELQQKENKEVLKRLKQENTAYLTDMLGWLVQRRGTNG